MNGDRVEVSVADLEAALRAVEVGPRRDDGTVLHPAEVAARLYRELSARASHREPEPGITRDRLVKALTGYHLVIGEPGGDAGGPVTWPRQVARELMERMDSQEPEAGPEPPAVIRDLTVTGRQIADALNGLAVEIEIKPGVAKSPMTGAWLAVVEGTVSNPGAVAAAILGRVPGFGEPRQAAAGVAVRLTRDDALRLEGWINAHRPPGDWDPDFLGRALRAIKKATGDGNG